MPIIHVTRSMFYKKRFIRNTSQTHFRNKKHKLVTFKDLRNSSKIVLTSSYSGTTARFSKNAKIGILHIFKND